MTSNNNSRAFLEVSESVTGQRWQERLDQRTSNVALAISQQLEIPDIVARVLAGRGISLEEAEGFLTPSIRDLMPDPSTLTAMDDAAERIADAVENREHIAIFGDYDVDGATSSAVMYRFLAHNGLTPEIYIPDRIFEGYGPNPAAIRELVSRGVKLIIAVDCGSTSFEAFEEAAKLGVDVVVFDHHQVGTDLPVSVALVNPNRDDDLSGQGHLCAAGVVYLGVVALNRVLRKRGWYGTKYSEPDLLQWLDLVATGTICDVVPLKGLNRAFVRRGLSIYHQRSNVGLAALASVSRMNGPAIASHLGFLIGPRINAGGRIGDAALGARLLTCEDAAEARDIAEQLDMLNTERQRMEVDMLAQADAEAQAEIGEGEGPAVLVTQSENWHPGVVGLLASRLKDRYRRPTFAIAFDGNGKGAGSGRSIPGVDLGAVVRAAVDEGILEKGGGHAMAAGITVQRSNLGALRSYFENALANDVAKQRDVSVLKIDGALSARGADLKLSDLLESAGPYGAGHSQPVFAFPAHTIRYADTVGANHVRFTIGSVDGAQLPGISFRTADQPLGQALLNSRGKTMHFAGQLDINHWQGQKKVQLRLLDAAELSPRI